MKLKTDHTLSPIYGSSEVFLSSCKSGKYSCSSKDLLQEVLHKKTTVAIMRLSIEPQEKSEPANKRLTILVLILFVLTLVFLFMVRGEIAFTGRVIAAYISEKKAESKECINQCFLEYQDLEYCKFRSN